MDRETGLKEILDRIAKEGRTGRRRAEGEDEAGSPGLSRSGGLNPAQLELGAAGKQGPEGGTELGSPEPYSPARSDAPR